MEDFLLALKPTFPDVQMNKSQVYPCTNLAVIETSYIMLEECACNQFHYIISMKQSPLVRMENKLHILKEKNVFPCNPMQSHRIEDTGTIDFKAFILYFENTFLETMAEELFGNRNLVLKNNCFELSPELRELIYIYIRECRAKQPGCSMMLDLKIEKAKDLLQSTGFSIEQICDLCGFSSLSYFSQIFKNKTSLTPTQFKGQYNHSSKLFFFKGKE